MCTHAIHVYACDTCVRMRYMCTHARYYYTHNAHAHRKLMGWAKQRRPRPVYLSCSAHRLYSYVIVSGFRAALDLDTYPLSNFIRPRCAERAKRGRGKRMLIIHIGFSLVFTPYLSNAVVSAKSPVYFSCPCGTEDVGIAHKPPRSL